MTQTDELTGPAEGESPALEGARTARWQSWAPVVLIAAAILLAYSNSFSGAFVLDDRNIQTDPTIRELWPPWPAMLGIAGASRPLIGLSLAINYAIGGLEVWSYHAYNFIIHVLAALTLYGIVRRAFLSDRLRPQFGQVAGGLALATALIWAVHPLQTQAVTYILQRCESQMGLFYLLTLYCAIRSFDSARPSRWYAAAAAACAAGMLSKQVMVTAPLMVLLYDTVLGAGTFRRALSTRRVLYGALAATWIVLGLVVRVAPLNETAGFEVQGIAPLDYLKSQFPVIVHYLELSLWPRNLVLDYAWPPASGWTQALPYALVVLLLAGLSLWALARRKPIGLIGAWFFLVLSLTSTVMPFSDLAVEHRMYLPLASVVLLVVIGGYRLGLWLIVRFGPDEQRSANFGRIAGAVTIGLVVVTLGAGTYGRNQDYHTALEMWRDVATKRPENARAHNNLGMLLFQAGSLDEAGHHFGEACRLSPSFGHLSNLGLLLMLRRDFEGARPHLIEAARLRPAFADARFNLGRNLVASGYVDQGIVELQEAVRINPGHADAHIELGQALEKNGRGREALESYQAALRIRPDWWRALITLALLKATSSDPSIRDVDQALKLAETAVRVTEERSAAAFDALGRVHAERGRFHLAFEAEERALQIASDTGENELAAAAKQRIALYREGKKETNSASGKAGEAPKASEASH